MNRIVQTLNPEMKDLIDMHGSDTEARGRARYAKMGLADKKQRPQHGERVEAEFPPNWPIGGNVEQLHRTMREEVRPQY